MSMPNIPDIIPEIDITREDVITLLLASVAMEEMGLAHILNAEGEKIQYALRHHGCGDMDLEELKELNKNVQQMVDAISRLQMLLQMKVENILSFTTTSTRTTCTHTTCTRTTCTHTHSTCTKTCTHTTASTTCTRSYTTCCCRLPCAITGQAEGLLMAPNNSDVVGTANVKCRVALAGGGCHNYLQYTAQSTTNCGGNTLNLSAMPRTLTVECPKPLRAHPTPDQPNQFVIQGQGTFSDDMIPASVSQVVVQFTLWVVDCGDYQRFRMKFHSPNYNLCHDSRFVDTSPNAFTVRCPG